MNASALMAAIAEGGANGAALAELFGVSRTMIWKTMQKLRSEGVQIEGTAGEGYRLVDPAGFGPHTLGWRLGREVHFFEQCGSTNVEARALAQAMENPGGTLVVANQQSAGRGRLGRTWDGEAGLNLMFSLVLEPPVIPQMAPACVLAWAAAMAGVLECQVKWPNDLITGDGRKLGGILAELSAEAEQVRFVVMGAGVNVNQPSFPGLPLATSVLAETGGPTDRAVLLQRLVAAIEGVDLSAGPSLELWRARSHTLGRHVRVGDVEGIAQDVREDGALLIDGHPVLAGDVEMVVS
jgi:BirA family biotin operon repressor/biotin-[acetyl-CoA-carboxylase] ligase